MLKYQGYLGLKTVQKLTEMSQKKESKATKNLANPLDNWPKIPQNLS